MSSTHNSKYNWTGVNSDSEEICEDCGANFEECPEFCTAEFKKEKKEMEDQYLAECGVCADVLTIDTHIFCCQKIANENEEMVVCADCWECEVDKMVWLDADEGEININDLIKQQ